MEYRFEEFEFNGNVSVILPKINAITKSGEWRVHTFMPVRLGGAEDVDNNGVIPWFQDIWFVKGVL